MRPPLLVLYGFGLASAAILAPPVTNVSITTERSADCNEWPDPGYGSSDNYAFYPAAYTLRATCYTERTINGQAHTYLRTEEHFPPLTLPPPPPAPLVDDPNAPPIPPGPVGSAVSRGGCFIDEMAVQAGNRDYTRKLPRCAEPRPYQVWQVSDAYLLAQDGFWMGCWSCPSFDCDMQQVQWGARHVVCWTEGEAVGEARKWWEDAHRVDGERCYVPADAFDGQVLYEMPGSGEKCRDATPVTVRQP